MDHKLLNFLSILCPLLLEVEHVREEMGRHCDVEGVDVHLLVSRPPCYQLRVKGRGAQFSCHGAGNPLLLLYLQVGSLKLPRVQKRLKLEEPRVKIFHANFS